MGKKISIRIIGEYNPGIMYHPATQEALTHAGAALSVEVEAIWVGSSLLADGHAGQLSRCHGVVCPPCDYESVDGALIGARAAREAGLPFLGT